MAADPAHGLLDKELQSEAAVTGWARDSSKNYSPEK